MCHLEKGTVSCLYIWSDSPLLHAMPHISRIQKVSVSYIIFKRLQAAVMDIQMYTVQ